jgi:hypothetical protein
MCLRSVRASQIVATPKTTGDQANIESRQSVIVAGNFSAKEANNPRNNGGKIIECGAVIILRIVEVLSVANQRDQKISVDTFVMVERNKRQFEQSQESADEENGQR